MSIKPKLNHFIDGYSDAASAVVLRNEFLATRLGSEPFYQLYKGGNLIVPIEDLVNAVVKEIDGKIVSIEYYTEKPRDNIRVDRAVILTERLIVDIQDTGRNPIRKADLSIEGFGDISDEAPQAVLRVARSMLTDSTVKKGSVYMMMSSKNGIEFKALPKLVVTPLERDNYTSDVLVGVDRIVQDLQTASPKGRIAIFDGKQGSGKTHLVKGLLSSIDDVIFIIIAPDDLSQMASPSVLPSLIDFSKSHHGKPLCFVIEDADSCLTPRGSDNMTSVSAVLNLGDGILGQILDIRLIMTTNAKRQEFDVAITRPGRLSACVKVDTVPTDKANDIYRRLVGKDGPFTGPATLAEVYSKAFDSGYVPVVQTREIGFRGTPSAADKINLALMEDIFGDTGEEDEDFEEED